jgi:hypothetical protein
MNVPCTGVARKVQGGRFEKAPFSLVFIENFLTPSPDRVYAFALSL